jgi:hypothetical protein
LFGRTPAPNPRETGGHGAEIPTMTGDRFAGADKQSLQVGLEQQLTLDLQSQASALRSIGLGQALKLPAASERVLSRIAHIGLQ